MAQMRERIGNLADTLLKYHMQNKQNDQESRRVAQRQQELAEQSAGLEVLKKIASNPKFALSAKQGGLQEILGVPIDTFAASGSDLGQPTMDEMVKSDDPTNAGEMLGKRLSEGPIITQTDKSGMSSLPDLAAFTNLENTREAHNSQIDLNREAKIDDAGATAQATAYGTGVGTNSAANENLPDLIKRINEQHTGTDKAVSHSAYLESLNQSRGQAEGQDPYQEGTPYLNTTDSTWHMMRRSNGKLVDVPLPPGYVPGGAAGTQGEQKLSAQQVDTLSSLNTAETEGVKVLTALHASGLDQSNDMLDPRWNTFAVGTLKIAPGDWNSADIVQRTQYVKAAILRSLMGARPSQYIAQIYNDHTPDSLQSGMQLAHVMGNILDQVGSRRAEIESLTGREPGKLKPVSGMTYEDWTKANGPQNPVGSDPTIDDFMRRPVGK
jgi:hypothetical protein